MFLKTLSYGLYDIMTDKYIFDIYHQLYFNVYVYVVLDIVLVLQILLL